MRYAIPFLLTLLASTSAMASTHGCQVLLCLADPSGPMTQAECRPPMRKLYRDLARGKPFPTCSMANTPGNSGNYAKRTSSWYDLCPAGTWALPAGQFAVQATAQEAGQYRGNKSIRRSIDQRAVLLGIGENPQPNTDQSGANTGSPKICVANPVGATNRYYGMGDNSYSITATLYERVVSVPMSSSNRTIDVYINNQITRRVFW